MASTSLDTLKFTSELLGLNSEDLRVALTARTMQTNKGKAKGTVIM